MNEPVRAPMDTCRVQLERIVESADDLKLAPNCDPAIDKGTSHSVRMRVTAAVMAGVLLVAVGLMRVRQHAVSAALQADSMHETAESVATVDSLPWQPAFQSALATHNDLDSTAEMLRRRLVDVQRRIRAAKTALPADDLEATELEAAWRTLRNRSAVAHSLALEEEAAALAAGGQAAASLAKLAAALRLQDEANGLAPTSGLKDFKREVRLREAVELATARPINEAIATARERADTALSVGNLSSAAQALREAQARQVAVNQTFRDSKAATPGAVARLTTEIETIDSNALSFQVQAAVAAAERAVGAGDFATAGKEWGVAASAQGELNLRFPNSREASAARADQFEVSRQTSLSRPLLSRALALDHEAAQLLRRRLIEPALIRLDEALGALDQAVGQFPRTADWDPEFARRVEYLGLKRRDLGRIQESVSQHLLAAPQRPDRAITGPKVSQALYSLVMHANPSRSRGDPSPVESVSWSDADEFCRRLSWILGETVRLPTEAEFRLTALQAPPPSLGSADMMIWLQPSSRAGSMALVGRRAGATPSERASNLVVLPRPKNLGSREIGFRYVIERQISEPLALNR